MEQRNPFDEAYEQTGRFPGPPLSVIEQMRRGARGELAWFDEPSRPSVEPISRPQSPKSGDGMRNPRG